VNRGNGVVEYWSNGMLYVLRNAYCVRDLGSKFQVPSFRL